MSNWILKNGVNVTDCPTFPYAFRAMFNAVQQGLKAGGKSAAETSKKFTIVGPANSKGDRRTYGYVDACKMAKDTGLLTPDGQLNSKEFKKKY